MIPSSCRTLAVHSGYFSFLTVYLHGNHRSPTVVDLEPGSDRELGKTAKAEGLSPDLSAAGNLSFHRRTSPRL